MSVSNYVDKLISCSVVKEDDKGIIVFGITQGIHILLNTAITVLIGVVMNMLIESIIFMAAYSTVRTLAGGVHARTQKLCYVYSIILIIAVLLLLKIMTLDTVYWICIALTGALTICVLAPVQDANKPLDEDERKVYKKRTVLSVVIILSIILFSFHYSLFMAGQTMALTLAVIGILMVIGKIKNYFYYQ